MQLALESADVVCPLFVRYRNRSKKNLVARFADATLPEGCQKFMITKTFFLSVVWSFTFIYCAAAQPAQQSKVPRIGVILPGGPLYGIIEGLRYGLNELGLQEGKQFTLVVRDTKGDLKIAEEAARDFEREKVNSALCDGERSDRRGQSGDGQYADCVLHRQRPGDLRTGERLRHARRQADRGSLSGEGPHREAFGNSQRDAAKNRSSADVFTIRKIRSLRTVLHWHGKKRNDWGSS